MESIKIGEGKVNQPEVEDRVHIAGPWLFLAKIMLAFIPVFGLIYSFNVTTYFGYAMWGQQAALVILGMALAATFLIKPKWPRSRSYGAAPSWADILLSVLALAICSWTAIRYEQLLSMGYLGTGRDYYINLAVSAGSLLVVIEALRRLTGWIMVVLVMVVLLYALFAERMPGPFQGQTPNIDFLLAYLQLDTAGMLGTPLSVVVSTVIAYVLLGNALFKMGGGRLFLDLPLVAMGRFRGGPAKASVLASSLFGSISGSAVANVATSGIVTIPLMRKTGYRKEEAAAIEAVGSTGGQLLPPIMGAAAFIMAELLGIPYADVALAALAPALLFYIALIFQIHLHAARRNHRPLSEEDMPDGMATVKTYWPFLIPIVILLALLFFLRWRPEQAAFASFLAVIAAALMVREQRISLGTLFDVFQSAGRSLLEIIAVTAAAGFIIGVLSVSGLSFSLGMSIAASAGQLLPVLLVVTAITAIIFGMGMPTTAVYILMATLLAPTLVAAGVEPLAAHLFVLYFGVLSMITPPVCIASFAAASMAGAHFMRTGVESLRFGAVAFIVPFIIVASPSLMLTQNTDWWQVSAAMGSAILGCLMMAVSFEAYLFRVIRWPLRLLAALTGLLLMLPEKGTLVLMPGIPTDRIGLLLAMVILIWCWRKARHDKLRSQ